MLCRLFPPDKHLVVPDSSGTNPTSAFLGVSLSEVWVSQYREGNCGAGLGELTHMYRVRCVECGSMGKGL